MDDFLRILGGAAICYIGSWIVRFAVRAELERAGIFRATRDLTEKEMHEVMGLMAQGKFNAAKALRDRYRFKIQRPR